MTLTAGTRLGPYELVAPLGRGAMGEVYRARDSRLARDVAIKVLPESTTGSPDALARFEREARAVAALNHPNIVALHDVGVEHGISYAVTELLEGETLRDRLLRDGPLAPRQVLELGSQVARGLAAAHERGIIHRDLKPENLFLTADGRAKILDFGVAVQDASRAGASADETRMATEPGLLVGTVGYMAPEQIRGEPASTRSDVFSFGLVLYELLTGANPFLRPTSAETMAAILRDQPDPLVVPGLPVAAARLIDRCLAGRPEDRPASIGDLGLYLELLSLERPSVAAPPVVPESGVRLLAVRMLTGICVLLLGLTAAMWGYVRVMTDRAAGVEMARDLERAESLVLRVQQTRLDRLHLTSRLVASFPELKALFETDPATIRDFLQSYQQRNPGTPLLIALGADGYVLARTDEATSAAPDTGRAWLAPLAASDAGVIVVDGSPYHAALAAAEAGGTLFGYVLAAAPVDSSFAQTIREATEDETILLDSRGLAGSTLHAGRVPWESLDAWRARGGSAQAVQSVTIAQRPFAAREVPLTSDPPLSAILVKSREEAIGPYRQIPAGLLTIGLTMALVVGLGGLLAIRRWVDAARVRRPR